MSAETANRVPSRSRLLRLGLALTVIVILYLGLDPLELQPTNHVRRILARPELAFEYAGIAWTTESIGPLPSALSVQITARSEGWPRRGLGTLLSLEDGTRPPVLVVAQWRSWLVVRVRAADRAGLGYREIVAENVFEAGRSRRIEISSNPGAGTRVEVDGVEVAQSSLPVVPSGVAISVRPVLGSQGDGGGSWRGVLQRLVIDKQEAPFGAAPTWSLATALAGHGPAPLVIPPYFDPPSPGFLTLPERRQLGAMWLARDLFLNALGFVPLGAILFLLLQPGGRATGRTIALATLGGLLLSLGIETVQVVLPLRVSSLSDLAFNGLGALLGALFGAGLLRVRARRDAAPNSADQRPAGSP